MAFNCSPKLSIFAVIVTFFLFHNLYEASAATGGRMGGSSFSSDSPPSSHRRDDDHYYDHHYRDHHHHYHNYDPRIPRNVDQENSPTSPVVSYSILTIFFGIATFIVYRSTVEGRTSILLVQVGLSAKARSIQKELNEIASTTDTSTAKGWNFILEETVSSLLHHPHCYLHGYSSVTHCWTIGGAEQQFQRLSKEERLKFDAESLVNVDNIKKQTAVPVSDKDKDRIVVTVLVAAQGAHKLPTINTSDNVKEALQSLADINSSKIKGVEVLWSPQDETDSLSIEELLENYPHLRRI